MKGLAVRLRIALLLAAIAATASYSLAGELIEDGGGGAVHNCCAKSNECKEVDNGTTCGPTTGCTGDGYKTCCSNACK